MIAEKDRIKTAVVAQVFCKSCGNAAPVFFDGKYYVDCWYCRAFYAVQPQPPCEYVPVS